MKQINQFINNNNLTCQEIIDYEKNLKSQGLKENNNFFNVNELWQQIQYHIKNNLFHYFFEFNGKYIILENNDIMENDIYLFILGKSKKEYQQCIYENKIIYDRELKDFNEKIPALKILYKNYQNIKPEYYNNWINIIDASLNSIYRNYILDCIIEILDMENPSLQDVKNKLDQQGHSGNSYDLTVYMLKQVSNIFDQKEI